MKRGWDGSFACDLWVDDDFLGDCIRDGFTERKESGPWFLLIARLPTCMIMCLWFSDKAVQSLLGLEAMYHKMIYLPEIAMSILRST